jgi:serine/threonine-protein kinase RsbW
MLSNSRFTTEEVFAIRLAVEEALLNAVIHGNKFDPAKEVHVTFTIEANDFNIRIQDEGNGFKPDGIPDPTHTPNADKLVGRGLLLMRHFMDAVRFNAKANIVTLTRKHRTAARTERAQQPRPASEEAMSLQANEIAHANTRPVSQLVACPSRDRS